MAMNQNFVSHFGSTIDDYLVHSLEDFRGGFVRRKLQVLPIEVVILNRVLHEQLGSVAEPNPRNDSVTTVGMLSRLLKIEHRRDS